MLYRLRNAVPRAQNGSMAHHRFREVSAKFEPVPSGELKTQRRCTWAQHPLEYTCCDIIAGLLMHL